MTRIAGEPTSDTVADANTLISIITVNYNGSATLPGLLNGVGTLLDSHPNFEHIIVDGASRDGSVEILEQHAATHANALMISEPDGGIYDAMNKGVRRSQGRYFIHLNSDDEVVHPERWREIAAVLRIGVALALATPVPIMRGALTIRILPGRPISWLHRRYGYHFPHQGTFFRRDVFDLVGGYDTGIGYIADKIFCYRLLDRIADSQVAYWPEILAAQQAGGISSRSRLTPLKTLWLTVRTARHSSYRNPYLRAFLNPIFKLYLIFRQKFS